MVVRKNSQFFLFRNRVVMAVLLLIVIFMSPTIWRLFEKEQDAQVKKEEVINELNDIKERKEFLRKDLSTLATPRGKEAFIRKNRDVAKDGEEIIIILDSLDATTTDGKKSNSNIFSWFSDFF